MFNDLTSGVRVATQEPLDLKEYCINEATLANLGASNNLAYTYFDGLLVYCASEKTSWRWREVGVGESSLGLMPANFTYPNGIVNNGINYSNRTFNFFSADIAVSDYTVPNIQQVLNAGNIMMDKELILDTATGVSGILKAWSLSFDTNAGYSTNYQSNGIFSINTAGAGFTGLQLPINGTNNVFFVTPMKPAGYYTLATIGDISSAINALPAIPTIPASIVPPFEAIDEGNGIGYIIRGRISGDYGIIGDGAIDFSYSDESLNANGATGTNSFASGINVRATNFLSNAFGYSITNNGIGSFDAGFNLSDEGYTNTLLGTGHEVTSMNTTVVGQASNIILSGTDDYNAYSTKPLFVVGNGTIQNNDDSYTVLTRSDAFMVRQNGVVTLPSITNTLITNESTGKVVVTREYLENIMTSTSSLKSVVVYVPDTNWWVNQQFAVSTGLSGKTLISVSSFFECIVAHDNFVIGDTIDTPRAEINDGGEKGPQGMSVQYKPNTPEVVYISISSEISILPAYSSVDIDVTPYLIPSLAKWKIKLVVLYI